MTSAVLITNPVAARTTAEGLRAVREALAGAGWRVEVATTGAPGDARRIAGDAVAEGVEVVVVQGGDGTTMQAAAALVGTGVSLGIVPGGTGNLLAGNLRIPRRPDAAARVVLEGHHVAVDLGRVERDRGTMWFGVACGAGPDARIMAETAASSKRRWGMAAYVATTLRYLPGLRPRRHMLTVDGDTFEVEASLILVANCGEVVPGFVRLGPGISPRDGVLDVIAVRAVGVLGGVRAVWEVLRDLPPGRRKGSFLRYVRGRVVTVASEPPELVEMDGEPDGTTPFTAEVVPGALSVLTPREPR